MSNDKPQFNKQEYISELKLKHVAETNEKMDSLKGIGIETVSQLEKVHKAVKEIKIPEPQSNEETHKLLKELTEEFKKPCHITLKLK